MKQINETTLTPLLEDYYVISMKNEDLNEVAYIEKMSNETFWDLEDFEKVLDEPGVQGRVIVQNEKIIGHFIFQIGDEDILLCNLTIHPDHRRKKIGSQVVNSMIGRWGKRLIINIRENNLSGHLFLKYNGMRAEKVSRGYFVDYDVYGTPHYEDAYVFTSEQKSQQNLVEKLPSICQI